MVASNDSSSERAELKPLSVLLVEDSADDAWLLERALRKGGYLAKTHRVETPAAMRAALDQGGWEVIISDYVLPRFGGLEALRIVQERQIDLPFIIVSGHIGEEIAVAAMKAGAHDYVMKDRLARLVPAIEREMREAEVRHARRQADRQLRDSEERFRQLAENIQAVFFVADNPSSTSPGRMTYVSQAYEQIWRRSKESLYQDAQSWLEIVHPEDYGRVKAASALMASGEFNEEFRITPDSSSLRWIHFRAFPVHNERGEVYRLAGIAEDITIRKEAEEKLALNAQKLLEMVGELKRTEEELRASNEALSEARKDLERRVQERTAELRTANAELQCQMKERRILENELLEIADKERKRIGIDLHDELGQHLNGIALMMKGLELKLEKKGLPEAIEAQKIQSLVFKTIDRAHDVAHDLASQDVQGEDLATILSNLAAHTAKVFAIKCEVKTAGDPPKLTRNAISQMYKIAQEAITNAVKHGRAQNVEVRLEADKERYVLSIVNDGLRFEGDKSVSGRMGLRIMRYRANIIGGSFEIHPGIKEGAVAICSVSKKGASDTELRPKLIIAQKEPAPKKGRKRSGQSVSGYTPLAV